MKLLGSTMFSRTISLTTALLPAAPTQNHPPHRPTASQAPVSPSLLDLVCHSRLRRGLAICGTQTLPWLFFTTAGFSPVAGLNPSRGGRLLNGEDDDEAAVDVGRSIVALSFTWPFTRACHHTPTNTHGYQLLPCGARRSYLPTPVCCRTPTLRAGAVKVKPGSCNIT